MPTYSSAFAHGPTGSGPLFSPAAPLPPGVANALAFTATQGDLRGLLASCAADGPGRVGFYRRSGPTWDSMSMSWFVADAYRCGRSFAAQGLRRGEIAVITVGDNPSVLRSFLGAIAIGALPLILPVRPAFDDTTTASDRLDSVLRGLPGNPAVIVAEGAPAPHASVPPRVIELSVDLSGHDGSSIARPPAAPGDIAYLQLSSGSTREPRPIAVTHEGAVAQLASIAERCELEGDDSFLIWLPLYHDLALVAFALLPMALRTSMYFMTPFDFLGNPSAWMHGISEHRITTTAAPNFGLRHAAERVREKRLEGVELSCVRRVCCGAEPIKASTFRAFLDRLAPHGLGTDVLVPTYGMAETTLMLTMPARQRPVLTAVVERSPLLELGEVSTLRRSTLDRGLPVGDNEVELVGVGPAGLGTEIFIVDEHGARLDRDLVCGEVVTRTTSLAAGYLRSDGSVDAFDPTGFRTGDIGFLDDGELYVVDRLKNIIIRSGQNISATAIEDLVAEVTGLPADTTVVIDSDLTEGEGRITALVEIERKADPDAVVEALVASADRFRPAVDDLVLLRANALPRTTSGKKQHRKTRLMLEAGELRVVSRTALTPERHPAKGAEPETIDLTRLEVAAATQRLVSAIARRRVPTVEVTERSILTSDLGLESVDVYELAVALEDELDIALYEGDLRDVRTVGDLIEIGTTRRRSGVPLAGRGITTALEAAAEPFPQLLRTADDQKDRQVWIDGRWMTDFASCNYLGLDLHDEVIEAIEPALRRWGVHPSWTRAVASPAPYRQLESALAGLIGASDTVVFPALTLLHLSVLPVLATPAGTILIDRAAHQSLQQAAELAAGRGTTVTAFDHGDLAELDRLLATEAGGPRVIVVDGVYSMSGRPAALIELSELAKRHDAVIYVDDAHGFGILGENPTEQSPYGQRGNGVVKYFGLDYERIVYCAGLSKAYSSMGAFVTVRTPAERRQLEKSATLVFSGPIPTASLASALAGLAVNDKSGDVTRARLRRLTGRLVAGIRALGFDYDNEYDFPIVNLTIGSIARAREAATILWDHGLLVTPSIYPAVPLDACGIRFTVTAANTDLEIDQALTALTEIAGLITADQPSSSATTA